MADLISANLNFLLSVQCLIYSQLIKCVGDCKSDKDLCAAENASEQQQMLSRVVLGRGGRGEGGTDNHQCNHLF